jgi:uncharacterized protein
MPNALIREKSPYLQQHAHNPVNWLPWGDGAFQRARMEDKPVFLSIGYSTCHWCHVMERESFENPEIAEILNQHFISIKVDREERPDVDRVYMLFVQATTGSGGWPMSVWLTPDRTPFFGGTYFPPDARYGRAGFPQVLRQIAEVWRQKRGELEATGERVTAQLRGYVDSVGGPGELNGDVFHSGFWPLRRSFDREFGGFGSAPKFPRPVAFNYLLREYASSREEEALSMVVQTLDAMAAGGMNDQLGGGFHRYSVDRHWFVPHFEKMLYDQAQLAWSYLEGFQITREPRLERTARQTLDYVLRDMRHSGGAFYSAEDADSADPDNPGHKGEGAFYIWRKSEIESLLSPVRATLICCRYGVKPDGNVLEDPQGEFTGKNILYEAASDEETAAESGISVEQARTELDEARRILFEARSKRPRPHLDDKILTAWNGLMISALAKAAQVLGDRTYLEAAKRAMTFLLDTMYSEESCTLQRRFRDGEAAIDGFLDDYAFLAQALLDLYEADFDPEYLTIAAKLAADGFARFEDSENGGFFSTAEQGESLLLRIKEDYDGAEPSGNSVATDVLLRLAHITGDERFRAKAEKSLKQFAPKFLEQPVQAPMMLAALGRYLTEPSQVVIRCEILGSRVKSLLEVQREKFQPFTTYAVVADADTERLHAVAPFLAGLERKGAITVYECANFVCQLPRVISTN